jgi:hypothetical protein
MIAALILAPYVMLPSYIDTLDRNGGKAAALACAQSGKQRANGNAKELVD